MAEIERLIKVKTADGILPTELFFPHANEPRPAVILFMDAPGIRDELKDFARDIARQGYVCVLPDLYYRIGHIRIDLSRRTPAHGAVYHVLASSLENAALAADTNSLLSALSDEPEISDDPVSCLGFSVGARFALQAAGLFPDRVAAVATVCGTGLVTEADNSPHKTLENVKNTAFLLDFASDDPAVSPEVFDELQSQLEQLSTDFDIKIQPETRHGYSFPIRPMYNITAATDSWSRFYALLAKVYC